MTQDDTSSNRNLDKFDEKNLSPDTLAELSKEIEATDGGIDALDLQKKKELADLGAEIEGDIAEGEASAALGTLNGETVEGATNVPDVEPKQGLFTRLSKLFFGDELEKTRKEAGIGAMFALIWSTISGKKSVPTDVQTPAEEPVAKVDVVAPVEQPEEKVEVMPSGPFATAPKEVVDLTGSGTTCAFVLAGSGHKEVKIGRELIEVDGKKFEVHTPSGVVGLGDAKILFNKITPMSNGQFNLDLSAVTTLKTIEKSPVMEAETVAKLIRSVEENSDQSAFEHTMDIPGSGPTVFKLSAV